MSTTQWQSGKEAGGERRDSVNRKKVSFSSAVRD